MTKISRKRRSRRSRILRRSTTSREYENIISAMEEAESRIFIERDGYLGAIADGLHNTLRLYWHHLANPPIRRGRETGVTFKPGRSTIKKMLADFPVTLSSRNSLAKALFEISIEGPHAPSLSDDIAEIAKSLCLGYVK